MHKEIIVAVLLTILSAIVGYNMAMMKVTSVANNNHLLSVNENSIVVCESKAVNFSVSQ